MFIKQIEVRNFKSYKELQINLNNLNILIGPNASGKSNFIRILKFLRNIATYNLNDAISMEGGVEYLRNATLGNSENLTVKVTYLPQSRFVRASEKSILIEPYEGVYEFQIGFNKRGGFQIIKDKLTVSYQLYAMKDMVKNGDNHIENTPLATGQITFEVVRNKIKLKFSKQLEPYEKEVDFAKWFGFSGVVLPAKTLFIETPFFGLANSWLLENHLAEIAMYDFDPKLSRKSSPVTGKFELEEDGNNLPIILNHILGDKEKRRKFLNIVTDILPFVEDFQVQKLTDKSLLMAIKEKHFASTYMPAFLLSDGTINITALIAVLYFEEKPLIILEEPERNVHPYIIQQLVALLNEVSKHRQIIISTHNPQIVKHAHLTDILLVARNQDGYSTIRRPAESQNIQVFLQNDMGLDELFIDNLLEV